MSMTHLEIFHGLIAEGMKMRYGSKSGKTALLRVLWEKKHIMDAGYIDYYLMAFWLFRHYADSMGISFWARGAVASSIVCYCLRLTEVDPLKYGLHASRFVNDELPKFQFDIEASRFDEFMKGAEELLQANVGDYDIPAIRKCLFQDLAPMEYLNRKDERPVLENTDDELVRYALYYPETMDLYEEYVRQPESFNGIIYQEQMMDILRDVFHVYGIKANSIRLAIQRGETEQVEAYKQELFANFNDTTLSEAETAWQRLTSNPRAFLKAHAVSRVLAKYMFEMY